MLKAKWPHKVLKGSPYQTTCQVGSSSPSNRSSTISQGNHSKTLWSDKEAIQ